MSKIYVVNFAPASDFKSVKTVGDLVFMTEGIVRKHPNLLHEEFRAYANIATDDDYLLLTGPQLLIAIAYAEWCRKFPQPSVFVWDKRRSEYIIHQIELPPEPAG